MFYSHRHSIFTKHDLENPVPTQFERAIRALDIEPILARSPQAKGRVERSFQTLQDRLASRSSWLVLLGLGRADCGGSRRLDVKDDEGRVSQRQLS